MASDRVPEWFIKELVELFLRFPSATQAPQAIAVAWWKELGAYPERAVRKAFVRAPREAAQAQYLPSCENVRRWAEVFAKQSDAQPDYSRPQLPEHEPLADLPDDNPGVALARKWEREDAESGRPPGAITPREIGRERLATIIAMLDGVGK